ncbi:MAG: hypothetical protein LBU17_10465 [Treponema sp.]|jgi:hypothetical protein|nr:hypothetical protein [Treponema sp.]
MDIHRGKKSYLILGLVIIVALGGGLFFLRAPVLVVTDASFNALYGIRRGRVKHIETACKLFRQVKLVFIGDSAEPEMVAFAVEEKAASPYCVLFPYRYYEGAGRYAEQAPGVPVLILGERNQDPQVAGTVFIETDLEADFHRAGQYAAIIARGQGLNQDQDTPEGGGILFFRNRELGGVYKDAFRSGLREQGFEGEPIYVNSTSDYSDIQTIACVVMLDRAPAFLERNLKTPVVLFSWIDPDLTSRGVKVVFDDSSWALAARAVALVDGKKAVGSIPSGIQFPGGRISDKEVLEHLKDVIHNSTL